MNSLFFSNRPLRRAAALLCAALAGAGLAGRASAQATGPLPTSPGQPTSYQSPLFHGGGALDPDPMGVPPVFRPGVFQGQLQGTPTGVLLPDGTVGTVQTQIPSFLLGNYDPALPPGAPGAYYPEHFADGTDPPYGWQAPFAYVLQSTGKLTVDDSSPAITPTTSGFTATPAWGVPITTAVSPAAGTATGSEYLRLPAGGGDRTTPADPPGTATWQFVETVAGTYSVYLNIPNDLPDINNVPEPRSTDVLYFITVRDANGNVTSTSTATASQTEANSNQFLAGPFEVQVGGTVTVTLTHDPANNLNDGAVGSFLVADSMILQKAIGDVQSTPTAINFESYPNDFLRAKYWGIYVPPTLPANATTQAVGATIPANATPDTTGGITPNATPLFHYGDPTLPKDETGAADPKRRIRQLVYFGRSEPAAGRSVSVDNNPPGGSGTFTGLGVSGFDSSATNGSYYKYGIVAGAGTNAPPVATWTLTAPNMGNLAANYFVNVNIPKPQLQTPPNEFRLGQVFYTVTYTVPNGPPVTVGPVSISQLTAGAGNIATLPTGPLQLAPGAQVKVELFNYTGTNSAPGNTFVVADSVTLTTGNGQGAIYCVDGFTGGVVWRYETPPSLTGASAAVYSSPAVVKINVLVSPAGPGGTPAAVYQNKLVVIVGDNNGLVYCLDAIGNGDGTSNSNVLAKDANGNPIDGQPIYELQPPYGPFTGTQVDAAGYTPHVGTTPVYWIYRPDTTPQNLPNDPLHGPKYIVTNPQTGAVAGTVKPLDVNADLPVPGGFNTASPVVFVDPNKTGTPDPVTSVVAANPDGSPPANATVYIGNSNGVLYALDATGTGIDGTSATSYIATGDPFAVSHDLRVLPTDPVVPTASTKWWFTLRGPDPNNANNVSNADIESAPALYVKTAPVPVTATTPTGFSFTPTVYIGSAHEQEATSNVGRLYALNGLLGPSGNNGSTFPATQPNPALPNYSGPGSFNYNVGQRPQISATDAADWSFPDAYDTTKGGMGQSSDKKTRSALGNVTGSPVVFTNTGETTAARQTRIYFAANSGFEVPPGSANGTRAAARPEDTTTGRVWAVNLDGTVGTTTNSGAGGNVWSYPLALDPNILANDTKAEPQAPMGSFLHGTPAIGFVQFPSLITGYTTNPTDVINTGANGILGRTVPMLYIATRGVDDKALYAIDIDGDINAATATAVPVSGDHRLIYREPSPDAAIFQSSPALVTNATRSGGNGGSVFVTAGNTFYDISATPISTQAILGNNFPLIKVNKEYTGFGPFSSPTVAATNTIDLLNDINNNELTNYKTASGYTTDVTDWVYVGDSSSGFCRGITPNDTGSAFGGIPSALGSIIPPDVNPPTAVDLSASLQSYLVADTNKNSVSFADALAFGRKTPLPVYEWGQNVYIRIANVVPPITAATDDAHRIVYNHDPNLPPPSASNPVTAYGNGGPVEFDIADATQGAVGTPVVAADHAVIPTGPLQTPGTNALNNGFYAAVPNVKNNLATSAGGQYIAAYTYTIADGSGRRNTPGSRRRILNAHQTVEVYTTTDGTHFTDQNKTVQLTAFISNGNEVSTPILDANRRITGYRSNLTAIPPVDQPTFGILNPLAIRGGGTNLLNPGSGAVDMGDTLGPYRGLVQATIPNSAPPPTSTDHFNLEALANGNDIPLFAPPSSAGGGGTINPTQPLSSTANADFNPPLMPHVAVTATPLIHHGQGGNNVDAAIGPAPTGNAANLPPNGLPSAGYRFGGYSMDLFDRSAVGLLGQRVRVKTGTVSSGGSGLYWNDNTNGGVNNGVVNFLPWETLPVGYKSGVGNNPSLDYPDISPSNITATLHATLTGAASDLSDVSVVTDPAQPGSTLGNRTVIADPIQFQIAVPRFQSANQQVYYEVQSGQGYVAAGEVPSTQIPNSNDHVFPMGYITTRRIYVPARGGFYRNGTAYRDVRVYTGVPPDYTMHMDNPTAEVGPAPSAFGIQTSHFGPLTTGYPPAPPPTDPLATFDPYNVAFQTYFKPLKISNTGNVNLLNVHLDQKQYFNGALVPVSPFAPYLSSDAVDPLSAFPAFDLYAITGPRGGMFGGKNVPEEPFLVRSSLDGDLATAFGINPYIVNNAPGATTPPNPPLSQIYPGATFHKARVGAGSPSTLTVPDAPESFVQGTTLDLAPTPTPGFKSPPFVSVAVPFGTPVGNYHTNLQLIEGVDGSGYDQAGLFDNNPPPGGKRTFSGMVAQLFPPQYGGAIGGIGKPAVDGSGQMKDNTNTLADGARVVSNVNPLLPPLSLTPNSDNATTVSVKVIEDRMTDGFTFGGVPMIDQGPAVPASGNTPARAVANFAPAAYRDPASGNLSVYWTSGRDTTAPGGYNIFNAVAPMLSGVFMPVNPASPGTITAPNYVNQWWTSLGDAAAGYNAGGSLKSPFVPPTGTNSGLTIAQDAQNLGTVYAFGVNVQAPPATTSYQNTLLCYPVTPGTGALGKLPQQVTDDPSQVKFGVKGLSATKAGYTRSLWAFWTTTTRGRTSIAYNSLDPNTSLWVPAAASPGSPAIPSTIYSLPVPAGLTAVSDAAPLLLPHAYVTGVPIAGGAPTTKDMHVIDVTYSGTGPDGNVDLYESRYVPDDTFDKTFVGYSKNSAKLDLTPFPAVTEILRPIGLPGGWSQARDVAWSRTSQLNLSVQYAASNGLTTTGILYDPTGKPLFSRAVFDKATGFLVLTNVTVPLETNAVKHTVYVDYATGRVRFVPALGTTPLGTGTQNYQVRAYFSPLARRITTDPRADTGPVTFLDDAVKANDAAPNIGSATGPVIADRRWYVWHKAGTGGASPSATIYYKTQRLTLFLPSAVGLTVPPAGSNTPPTLLVTSVKVNNVDITSSVDVDYTRGRIYFPINAGGTLTEGQTATVTYAPANSVTTGNPNGIPFTPAPDVIQWQDEEHNSTDIPPVDTAAGLNAVTDTLVPLDHPVNENNVSAFLDPEAYSNTASNLSYPHKVWLFWNSTRNGTADVYYETINPLFAAGP